MCDFCGCPSIEPFATLTEDHSTMEVLAELFDRNGESIDLGAVRVTWDDHRAAEAVLEELARRIDLIDVLGIGREQDAGVDSLLSEAAPDAGALLAAIRDHVDTWEFDVFPQLVLSADLEELQETARLAEATRGS